MNTDTNNPAPTLAVLDPIRELTVNGEKLAIRELAWPDALKFSLLLFERAAQFAKEGKFDFRIENFGVLIGHAADLSNFLILKSTGKDEAWLNSLTTSAAFDVLDAALSINLSPEVMGKAKKAAGRFALAIGVDAAALVKKQSPPASIS